MDAHPRRRRRLAAAVLTVAVVGIPGAAYAGSRSYDMTIDGGSPAPTRIPGSASDDFAMPARPSGNDSSGTVWSDVSSCPRGDAAYNEVLYHDLRLLPDEIVLDRSDIDYCHAAAGNHPGWPSGDFHFNVGPYYLGQPDGHGYIQAQW